MMKSTILCLSMVSVWLFVIRNEISYPCVTCYMQECQDRSQVAHLYRFPPEHNEALCSLHHESCEFVTQYPLNFIGLLDLYAETNRIHRRFDENALVLVTRDGEGCEENFLRATTVLRVRCECATKMMRTHPTSTSGLLCLSTTYVCTECSTLTHPGLTAPVRRSLPKSMRRSTSTARPPDMVSGHLTRYSLSSTWGARWAVAAHHGGLGRRFGCIALGVSWRWLDAVTRAPVNFSKLSANLTDLD